MFYSPKVKKVSFSEVAFKGSFRWMYAVLIILAVGELCTSVGLSTLAPPSYSGTAMSERIPFEVLDSTQSPVVIHVSHSYHFVTTGSSLFFHTDDGVDEITYNVTIYDDSGKQVFQEFSRLNPPDTHEFSPGQTEDTVVIENLHEASLSKGTYKLDLESVHPVDYQIVEKSKYETAMQALAATGVLSILLLIGVTIIVLRRRDAIQKAQMIASFSAGQPGPMPGYYSGGRQIPYSPGPSIPAPLDTRPSPDTDHSFSLEYVPGQIYTEYLCPACGMGILNRPVDGIVTCEHCGEKGRAY